MGPWVSSLLSVQSYALVSTVCMHIHKQTQGDLFNAADDNALDGRMSRHCDRVVCGVEEVHFDGAQQAELVWILVLELLSCLEPVHELSDLLAAAAFWSSVDTVHHLHLRSVNATVFSTISKGAKMFLIATIVPLFTVAEHNTTAYIVTSIAPLAKQTDGT